MKTPIFPTDTLLRRLVAAGMRQHQLNFTSLAARVQNSPTAQRISYWLKGHRDMSGSSIERLLDAMPSTLSTGASLESSPQSAQPSRDQPQS